MLKFVYNLFYNHIQVVLSEFARYAIIESINNHHRLAPLRLPQVSQTETL